MAVSAANHTLILTDSLLTSWKADTPWLYSTPRWQILLWFLLRGVATGFCLEFMASGIPEIDLCQGKERPESCYGESGHCQALWLTRPHIYNGLNSITIMWCSVGLNLTLNGFLDSRRASCGREIWARRFFSENPCWKGKSFSGHDLLIDIPVLTQLLSEAFKTGPRNLANHLRKDISFCSDAHSLLSEGARYWATCRSPLCHDLTWRPEMLWHVHTSASLFILSVQGRAHHCLMEKGIFPETSLWISGCSCKGWQHLTMFALAEPGPWMWTFQLTNQQGSCAQSGGFPLSMQTFFLEGVRCRSRETFIKGGPETQSHEVPKKKPSPLVGRHILGCSQGGMWGQQPSLL